MDRESASVLRLPQQSPLTVEADIETCFFVVLDGGRKSGSRCGQGCFAQGLSRPVPLCSHGISGSSFLFL